MILSILLFMHSLFTKEVKSEENGKKLESEDVDRNDEAKDKIK